MSGALLQGLKPNPEEGPGDPFIEKVLSAAPANKGDVSRGAPSSAQLSSSTHNSGGLAASGRWVG